MTSSSTRRPIAVAHIAAGKLDNPSFLDYRLPVCSDVPMIDTVIVEVPNPRHPHGVRGIGETPIVTPMGAIAIDGEIFQDAWLEPVGPHSEVHLVPPIGGG